MNRRLPFVAAATGTVLAATLLGAAPAAASSDHPYGGRNVTHVHAKLTELNNSGATGKAKVKVYGNKLDVDYRADDLHHFALTHECVLRI